MITLLHPREIKKTDIIKITTLKSEYILLILEECGVITELEEDEFLPEEKSWVFDSLYNNIRCSLYIDDKSFDSENIVSILTSPTKDTFINLSCSEKIQKVEKIV